MAEKIELEKGYQRAIAERENCQNSIAMLGDWAELKNEKALLRAENKELFALLKEAKFGVRVHNFKNGFGNGIRSRKEMTDEEYEAYRKDGLADLNQNAEEKTTSKVYKKTALRPHQALRKIISEVFGEN